jgi:hypothetical protein
MSDLVRASLLPAPEDLHVARLQKDLAYFVRTFWPILEPGTDLTWNWHIDVICKHLMMVTRGEHKNLAICIPPGCMKSLLVSVFYIAWEWLQKPSERTICAANDESLAVRDSIKCRTLVGSPEYRDVLLRLVDLGLLSDVWGMHDQQDQRDNFANTATGFRQCVTVDKKVTGKRGDKIIVDDPTDVSEVTRFGADIVRKKLEDTHIWFSQVLSSRVNNKTKAHFVIIMQRLHELDLIGRLQGKPGWHFLVLPMEFDPARAHPDDIRTIPGELLFPGLFPREAIDIIKNDELTRENYAAQHDQRPMPADGGMFREEFFNQRYIELPPKEEFVLTLLSADCANKAKRKNDQSSFKFMGLHNSGRVYMLGSSSIKKEYHEMSNHFCDLLLHWRPRATVIEDAANGTSLLSALEHLLAPDTDRSLLSAKHREVAEAMAGSLVVWKEKPTEGKEVRAKAQVLWYQPQQRVLLPPDGVSWVRSHIDQHLRFGASTHDDEVDATCQGLKWLALYSPDLVSACPWQQSLGMLPPSSPVPLLGRGDAALKKTDIQTRAGGGRFTDVMPRMLGRVLR